MKHCGIIKKRMGRTMARKYKTPVKASKLIAKLNEGGFVARVVDVGDAGPVLTKVSVCVEENHRCTLSGSLGYREDELGDAINDGLLSAVVLGVVFSRSLVYDDNEVYIDAGREIVYDEGLTESDVLKVANEGIRFRSYNPDNYSFDETAVDDDEISYLLDLDDDECGVFALDESGAVCAFSDEEQVPETGYTIIGESVARAKLVKDRPGFTSDF